MSPAQNIRPEQFRAARCLLNWSVADAMEATDLSRATINRVERSKDRTPSSHAINLLRLTYEQHGIEFQFDGGIGVKLKD